jgi:hypothetical protein
MADLLLAGIDSTSGQQKLFEPDVDTVEIRLPVGTPDALGDINVNVNGIFCAHDGVIAAKYLRTDTYSSSIYSGGDIDIGTTDDSGFTDVDVTNAKIAFTVTIPGVYLVTFAFTYFVLGNINSTLSSITSFRLSDGTNTSNTISIGETVPGITGVSNFILEYSNISYPFLFTSSGSKTVTLQKKNTQSINLDLRRGLANADSNLFMSVFRIADQ